MSEPQSNVPGDDVLSESDLDALLAQASSLASDLASDDSGDQSTPAAVASDDDTQNAGTDSVESMALPESASEGNDSTEEDDAADELDSAIGEISRALDDIDDSEENEDAVLADRIHDSVEEMDDLAGSLANEIGAEPVDDQSTDDDDNVPADLSDVLAGDDVDDDNDGVDDDTEGEEEADDVPDFMKEFMEPSDEPIPDQPLPAFLEKTAGTKADAPDSPDEADQDKESNEADNTTPGPSSARVSLGGRIARMVGRYFGWAKPITDRLSTPAFIVAGGLVFVLELLDKPLGFVGPRIRHFLGVIAIATIGAAFMVMLMSAF